MNTDTLCSKIGYSFQDAHLLRVALTHPSMAGIDKQEMHYQRLEFLGDSVLSLAVSTMLWDQFPEANEGELSHYLSCLVCGTTLSKIAQRLDLGQYLRISKGEEKTGGRDNKSNLENSMEALIGAIYRDGGFTASCTVVAHLWKPFLRKQKYCATPKDAKTHLQEWVQKHRIPLPDYVVLEQTGTAHALRFRVAVHVQGYPPVEAESSTKKEAQKMAASLFLEYHT